MRQRSTLPALSVGVSGKAIPLGVQPAVLFEYRGELTWGSIEYDGSGTLRNNMFVGLLEGNVHLWRGIYIGLGYRYLLDDKVVQSGALVRTSTGFLAYDRISSYLYLPIGASIDLSDGSSLRLQFNQLLRGEQFSKLSQTGLEADIRKPQREGYGLDLSWSPSRQHEFFLRYWAVEDSDIVRSPLTGAGWVEPKNFTYEAGYRLYW